VIAFARYRRRARRHPPDRAGALLTTVIVTIGLVLIFNGLVSLIWTAEVRAFPSPFPNGLGDWWRRDLAAGRGHIPDRARDGRPPWAFFQFTKVGLALRPPRSIRSEPAGRRPRQLMLAIGWGLPRCSARSPGC
jgi:branched-chain amino acid transport system permease protein